MNIELVLIPIIFFSSLLLLLTDKKLAIHVLLVLSVLLHKQLFKIYSWNFLPIRVFMLAFLAWSCGIVAYSVIKKKTLKPIFAKLKDPFIMLLVALWFVRVLSLFFTKNLGASINLLAFFTTIVSLGIFLYLYLKDAPHQTLAYIKTYIFILFALCLFAYFQAYLYLSAGKIIGALWNIPDKFPRLGSLFWDVNHFGGLLAALLPVLGALILSAKKIKHALLYSLMLLPMSGVLLFTNSRTSWILAGVAGLTFVLLLLFKRFGKKGIFAIGLVLAFFTGIFLSEYSVHGSPLREKINNFFHYRMDSFDAHFMLIKGAIEIFNKYPVLGGGYGGFFEHFADTSIAAEYFGRDPAAFTTRVPAHTIWGEVLSETGLVGLSIFVLFMTLILGSLLYLFFKTESKEQTLLSSAMFASILGWLVAGIFYSYNSEFFFLVLFLYFMYAVSSLGKDFGVNQMVSFLKNRLDLGFILLSTLSFALIFISLGKNHLIPWDEAIYAGVSKNMVKTSEYLVMEWVPGKVWFEKPPLMMWLMAGFMKLMGVGEWAARIPSAMFGFSTILLVYIWAKKLFGKGAAFISGLALLTSVHFLYYARASMMDVSVTFFITLALYFYYYAKQNKKSSLWLLSGLSIGLAIMTKGVVGLLPFAIIGLYELYLFFTRAQKLSVELVKNYSLLFIYALIIVLPWHLYMHLKFGADFWANYIGYHVFDRALTAIEDKGQPFFWYLIVMKVSMRIWFVALIPAFAYGIFKAVKKQKKFVFLLVWSLFIFLFFSIAKSKLIWYMTPIYPVAVMFVGIFIRDATQWMFFVLCNLRSKPLRKLFTPKEIPLVGVFLSYFAITVFGLTYFYYHKHMVYTGDLTGSQAKLLKLKDVHFGLGEKVYADRIELPLILFYSDSPYEQVDYSPLKQRLKSAGDNKQIVFITKGSRYSSLKEDFPRISSVQADGDWILGYLPVKPPEPLISEILEY